MSTLASLATEIVAEHEACETASKSAVEHAIRCGELLIEAKGKVEHGGWSAWLAENFPATERTARRYMQLAANRTCVSDLPSVNAALAELAEPRPTPEPSPIPSPSPPSSRPVRPDEPQALTDIRDEHKRTHVIHHLASVNHKMSILQLTRDALMDQLRGLPRNEAQRFLDSVEHDVALLQDIERELRDHLSGHLKVAK